MAIDSEKLSTRKANCSMTKKTIPETKKSTYAL